MGNGATIAYRREIGGREITVDRHLNQLYPFMGVEHFSGEERIHGLAEDGAAGVIAPGTGAQLGAPLDEVTDN